MKATKTIISSGLKYKEDQALQDFWENGKFKRMIKIDPDVKPWEQNYPYSREIWEFEASSNTVIATRVIDHQKLVIRYIAEGDFKYSRSNTLKRAQISRYHMFFKGVDGNDFDLKINYSFEKMFSPGSSDWETIYNKIATSSYAIKPVAKKIATKYAPSSWEQKPFGNDFITGKSNKGKNNNEGKKSKVYTIVLPEKFSNRLADKITNFNASTDTLEIDTDSFGIDSSATFATAKNKKKLKKLAKKDYDFLYDEKKGGLYFNENGADKGVGVGGIIAILKGAPNLIADNVKFT